MTDNADRVQVVADLASRHGFRVGVAESLTSGLLAGDLGAGPDASAWFRGGVVAYASEVKFEVLGVTRGPVVTRECALEMAHGAAELLDADAVVATTGVGGPEPEEGQPPGTVYVAALVRDQEVCRRLDLAGEPEQVLEQTREHSLEALVEAMEASLDGLSGPRRQDTARGAAPAG
ncbi:nicotinamide-nucleotide amidase [Marmoricola sp. URHA0025 HA25]